MRRLYVHVCRCLLKLSLVFLLASLCGCGLLPHRSAVSPAASLAADTPKNWQKSGVAPPTELQGEVMRFADQYSVIVAQGLDDFAAQVGTPKTRAQALDRKVNQASAAMTIASGPSPIVNLLDIVVLVTLTRIAQENYWVSTVYGDQARPLLALLKTLEADVWNLAARHLSPDQLQQLRELIDAWRKKYPEQRYTAFLHFTEFAAGLGTGEEQTSVRRGSIFSLLHVDPLAGLDPTIRQLEQTRYLAERAIYYGQRMPILLQWRSELMFFNLTATPEIQHMLSLSERWTKTAEQLPALVDHQREAAIKQLFEGVANERTNIIASLMVQKEQATDLLTNLRETLAAGTETATALKEAVHSSDALLQNRQQRKEKSGVTNTRAFDIREYGPIMSEAAATATQLNVLVNSGSQSLPKLERTGKTLATYIFTLALLFLAAIVVAVLAYRFLARVLFGSKRNPEPIDRT